jgi:MFS family permease
VLVPLRTTGFNLLVVHPRRVVSALAAAAHNDNVRRVQLAWGGAIAAEWAHFVALGVFAYEHGGTAAVGLAGLVRLLPAAAVAPFAASLGDRFRRERFLLAMSLVGAAALAASALAALADANLLVYVFAAVFGVCTTLFRPALQALLPSLARTPEELIAANGATSTVESVGTLAGPLLAGVLVSVGSVGVVFIVGAGLLMAAAGALARVRVEGRIVLSAASDDETARGRLLAGVDAIVRAPQAPLIVLLAVAQAFVRGCLNVLIVVAAFRVLHGGAGQVGYLTAAIGIGGLIGAFWAMTLKGRRLAIPFGFALVLWGLPIALIAPRPAFLAAAVLLAVVGAANSVEDVALFTLLQRIIPEHVLTRALGLFWGIAMGAVALGSIVAPLIVEAIGPRPALIAVGSILPLLTLASYRRLRELDRNAVPAPEVDLVDGVPIFAPLSLATKERVAANLIRVSVPAGEVVIRAGHAGDRFYIVGEGMLDIDAGGVHVTAGAGDYFGEIALLRDVPRTATVTAVADSQLYALERDAFLAAVTGHSAAHAAGHEVADERLARAGPIAGG